MRAWASKAVALGTLAVGAVLAACVADSSSSSAGSAGVGWAAGGGSSSGSGAGGSGASAQPMLVDVDPNVPLTVSGGQGVGVFTAYSTGGHWQVSWSCDTSLTGLKCDFDVVITARTGALTNPTGQLGDNRDQVWQPDADSVRVTTVTSTVIDGVTFDAAPGAIITVDASMGGLRDGAFMFFVQDGVRNGGYTGQLTDPLMFEPSSP